MTRCLSHLNFTVDILSDKELARYRGRVNKNYGKKLMESCGQIRIIEDCLPRKIIEGDLESVMVAFHERLKDEMDELKRG